VTGEPEVSNSRLQEREEMAPYPLGRRRKRARISDYPVTSRVPIPAVGLYFLQPNSASP
jgi:hypothetical protein